MATDAPLNPPAAPPVAAAPTPADPSPAPSIEQAAAEKPVVVPPPEVTDQEKARREVEARLRVGTIVDAATAPQTNVTGPLVTR